MAEKMLLDADRVIGKFEQWNREDAGRASSAAETRQDIGDFVEATGYHAKALSDGRKLYKLWQKDPEKFEDYLRTFEPLYQDVKNHCRGQSTPDMFEPTEPDEGYEMESDDDPSVAPFDPDMDEEVEAFEAAADEALG